MEKPSTPTPQFALSFYFYSFLSLLFFGFLTSVFRRYGVYQIGEV